MAQRAMRMAAITLLLATMVASLAGISAPAASATVALRGRVGVASSALWFSEADAKAHYARLAAGGLTWVREDFRWDLVEPSNGTWSWSKTDAVMAGAAAAGVDVLAILGYSAKWASSDPSGAGDIHYPPKDNADYADYARAVVQRYGPGGTFWAARPDLPVRPLTAVELWNEPWGWWFWKSGVDPVRYAAMARAAATAVKAVQPQVKVLLSADLLQVRTDGKVVPWFDHVLAADPGLAGYIDAYSVHPYPYPRQQGPMVDNADARWDFKRVELINQVAVARGVQRPLWITEVGWSTANTADSVTESQQATFMTQAISRAATWSFIDKVFIYTATQDRPDMTDREAHYGMRRADGSWKPSWTAVTNLVGGSTTIAPAPTTTTPTLTATVVRRSTRVGVDLRWSGAPGTSVVVQRQGLTVLTTTNDGAHFDRLASRFRGTLTYKVCEVSLATCSRSVSVTV